MSRHRTGPRLLGSVMLVLCAGCMCAAAREAGVPNVAGDGTLRVVDVPGHRGINSSASTGDGRFVVFATTGPEPIMYVTDEQLVPLRATEEVLSELALSKAGTTVLCSGALGSWFRLVSVPGLHLQQELEVETRMDMDRIGGIGSLGVWAWEKGWVHVNRGGQVVLIEGSPLKFGRSGRAGVQAIKAVAVDDRTGTLILCGENRAEVFDLTSMETAARVRLDDVADYDACAGDGVAWIATTSGAVLRLDLRTASITGRTPLAEETRPTNLERSSGARRSGEASRQARQLWFADAQVTDAGRSTVRPTNGRVARRRRGRGSRFRSTISAGGGRGLPSVRR